MRILCLIAGLLMAAPVLAQDYNIPFSPAVAAGRTVDFALVQAAATIDTPPYTQDFTSSGFGTPKGAVCWGGSATEQDTNTAEGIWWMGFADGTNQLVGATRADDAVGTSVANSRGATDEFIMIMASNGAIDGEAAFTSFITDGIRVTWGDEPTAAYLVTCMLMTGSDLSVDVGTITTNSTQNGTATVTGLSYEPDGGLFLGVGNDASSFSDASTRVHAQWALGMSYNDGTATEPQFAASHNAQDAVGTSSVCGGAANNRIHYASNINSATAGKGAELTDWTSDGFELTTRDVAGSKTLGYIVWNVNSAISLKVGDENESATTGSASYTDAGFQPYFVFGIDTTSDAYGFDCGFDYPNLNIYAWDGTTEYNYNHHLEDNDAGSATNDTRLSTSALYGRNNSGATPDAIAEFTSFDANGWTLNWTNDSYSASVFYIYYAFE